MAHAHVQVAFQHDSGLPSDVTVNNFSINTLANTVLFSAPTIDGLIENFYTDLNENHSLDYYLSGVLAGPVVTKYYDRSDAEPRVPKYIGGFDLSGFHPGTTAALPSQVACVLSFQGTQVSGSPQGRRRGRFFLGPLNEAALELDGSVPRPAPNFVEDVLSAAATFAAGITSEAMKWEVWSAADNQGITLVQAWVDNRFDTQRRRLERTTERTAITL